MFKLAQAVYPAHGGRVIEDIMQGNRGCKRMFYVLRILEKDMTINDPKASTDGRIARIIQKKDVPKVIRILSRKMAKWIARPGTAVTGSIWRRSNPFRL